MDLKVIAFSSLLLAISFSDDAGASIASRHLKLRSGSGCDITDPSWTPSPFCPWPAISDELIFFPDPDGDCNKYYECLDGCRYDGECPPELWWDPILETCAEPGPYCTPGDRGCAPNTDPRCTCKHTSPQYFNCPDGKTTCDFIECVPSAPTSNITLKCPPGTYWTTAPGKTGICTPGTCTTGPCF